MPKLLRDAGYRTALIGKWHLGYLPHYSPLKSGYDEFFGVMGGFTGYYTHIGDGGQPDLYDGETPIERVGYVTDMLSERATAWVAAAAAWPEPYFLSLHYTAPHWPWSAPSVEAAARRREVERTELTEGGNTRIYGEMISAPCPGVQPRQFHANPGDAQDRGAVVADQPAEKLIKIGAKVVSHGRYVTFQMAEVAVSRQNVRGYPDAHCPAACTAGTGMSGAEVEQTRTYGWERCALTSAMQRVPATRGRQSSAFAPHGIGHGDA